MLYTRKEMCYDGLFVLDDAIMVVEGRCVVAHHGDDPFFDFFLKKQEEKGFFRAKPDEKDFPLFYTLELLDGFAMY